MSSSGKNQDESVSGWEDAMNVVIENEYSERVERLERFTLGSSADAPMTIIQSVSDESSPNTELASNGSGTVEKDGEHDNARKANDCLDLAASSCSTGSQGADADQVPVLSGSGSADDPIDVVGIGNKEKGDSSSLRVGVDESTTGQMKREPSIDVNNAASDTAHTRDTLGEILGPRSEKPDNTTHSKESISDILGPKDMAGRLPKHDDTSHTRDTVSDILGRNEGKGEHKIEKEPKSDNRQDGDGRDEGNQRPGSPQSGFLIDLQSSEEGSVAKNQNRNIPSHRNELTSPYEREVDLLQAPSDSPVNAHEDGVDRFAQEMSVALANEGQPQFRRRLLIGPKGLNVSESNTFDSRLSSTSLSVYPQSPRTYATNRNGSTGESNTFSLVGTLSDEDSSYSQGGSNYPREEDAFSPRSLSGALSSGSRESYTEGETTNTYSYDETTLSQPSTADPSVFSGQTGHTTRTGYTSDSRSYTGHSGTVRSSDSETDNDASYTEHTRKSESGRTRATKSSQSDASGYGLMDEGRENVRTPKKNQIAESLMARTRSRADTSAILSASSTDQSMTGRPHMIRVGEEVDEQFIMTTAMARKRVKVVQLLIVGLFGLLVCIFGSVMVQSSCHFVSADVAVGETNQVYNLHFGLWKFSSVGSAFQGYSYCDGYDSDFTVAPPYIPRLASLIASIGGTYAVFILWIYLIIGRGTRSTWNAAVQGAILSGLLHGASLTIFLTPICVEKDCRLGPAGIIALVASAMNFILAFEMYYNSPIASWMDDVPECPSYEEPRRMIQTLEMTDLQDCTSAYFKRVLCTKSQDIPTLNQIQRNNEDPIGEAMFGRDLGQGVYAPPAIV